MCTDAEQNAREKEKLRKEEMEGRLERRRRWLWPAMTVVGSVAAGSSIAAMTLHKFWPEHRYAPNNTWIAVIAVVWVLGPPLWFAFENAFLIPNSWDEDENKARMSRFKRGQDVAKAVWLAVGALAVGTLIGEPLHRAEIPAKAACVCPVESPTKSQPQ